jgi:hypothetical protein
MVGIRWNAKLFDGIFSVSCSPEQSRGSGVIRTDDIDADEVVAPWQASGKLEAHRRLDPLSGSCGVSCSSPGER